ncbi:cysteine protease ATG4C [Platysternon megacephalum]|uniref:Cysteine protease ATG4C n=1 Tax=Platysternon megacephalum TaxID=55544 RepID=A0A4D9EY85_9SAUR|nr:cysteine protease ATG4C [Platysternon megacephalum]
MQVSRSLGAAGLWDWGSDPCLTLPAFLSREDGPFQKPEPGFAELEKRLSEFSLKSAILQEVLLGFKETLRLELENSTGKEQEPEWCEMRLKHPYTVQSAALMSDWKRPQGSSRVSGVRDWNPCLD